MQGLFEGTLHDRASRSRGHRGHVTLSRAQSSPTVVLRISRFIPDRAWWPWKWGTWLWDGRAALVGHMMHSVRTVLLCCCRHASAASQCPRAPEPRACLLSRCLVDYLPHGATGAVRLERYRRHGWQVLPTCRNCHCCVHSSSPGPQYTTVDLCVWLWSAV